VLLQDIKTLGLNCITFNICHIGREAIGISVNFNKIDTLICQFLMFDNIVFWINISKATFNILNSVFKKLTIQVFVVQK